MVVIGQFQRNGDGKKIGEQPKISNQYLKPDIYLFGEDSILTVYQDNSFCHFIGRLFSEYYYNNATENVVCSSKCERSGFVFLCAFSQLIF